MMQGLQKKEKQHIVSFSDGNLAENRAKQDELYEKNVEGDSIAHDIDAGRKLFSLVKGGKEDKLIDLLQKYKKENESNFEEVLEKMNLKIKNKKLERFVNQKDDRGNTPQHYAAKDGNKNILITLSDYGADLHAVGQNGLKVIDFAARYGEDQNGVWKCINFVNGKSKGKI